MTHPISDALAGMTPEERAAYKTSQFAAMTPPDSLLAGTRMVAVNDITTVNGILQFTVAMWGNADGLGWALVDLEAARIAGEWGGNPVRVVNPPILVPDLGGDIERVSTRQVYNPVTHVMDTVVTSTFYREDLDSALMQIAYDVTEKVTLPSNEI
jgi:hypothetical protein